MKRLVIAATLTGLGLAAHAHPGDDHDQPELTGAYSVGPFVVTLTGEGHYAVVNKVDGSVAAMGAFTAKDGVATLLDYAGPQTCGFEAMAELTYEATAEGVAFTVVQDPCAGRAQLLNGSVWTPVEDAQ